MVSQLDPMGITPDKYSMYGLES